MTNSIQSFVLAGAYLNCSVGDIREKLSQVKVFLFDWDGVFNSGEKFGTKGSPFAEPDSMGTNLLRLGYWLKHGNLPVAGILTGAVNEGVDYFARRECLDVCMRGYNNKRDAWDAFQEYFDFQPHEVAYVFDDVIDIPMAERSGLRFMVDRKASPAFRQYVIDNNLCDYITANPGGQGAVREVCEFMLCVMGMYEEVVRTRASYEENVYKKYLGERKAIKTVTLLNS